MGSRLDKFRADYPLLSRVILHLIPLLFNIGTALYLLIDGSLKYAKYSRRDDYSIGNFSDKYYVYKTNLTDPANCSNQSAFDYYPYGIYVVLSRESPISTLFSVSFWIGIVLALVLKLIDIWQTIVILRTNRDKEEIFTSIGKFFYLIYMKLLKNYTFVATLFLISLVDYSQLCLEYHSVISSYFVQYAPTLFILSFFGIPNVIADICFKQLNSPRCSYTCVLNWASKTAKKGFLGRCRAWYLVWSSVACAIIIGLFVTVLSLIEKGSRLSAILVIISMIITLGQN
jgi:hypothetical protein